MSTQHTPDHIDLGILDGAVSLDVNSVGAVSTEVVSESTHASAGSDSGRDLVNQLLGQAQAFSAASQLLQTFGVSKLAFVKENRLYKGLAGMRAPNGLELKGTWEEFCGLLGMSDEKVNQDIANLRAFGEEALESMNRMGIGYRELRQFRKLPPDQREALALIAKSGNREDLLEAALDAIEKEKASARELQLQNAELKGDIEGFAKRAANTDAELERREHIIAKLSKARLQITEFTPRTEDVRSECLVAQGTCEFNLRALLRMYREATAPHELVPEREIQVEQVWITLHTIAAMALDAINHIREEDIQPLPDRVLGQHLLTPEEAKRWIVEWRTLEGRMQAEAAVRQQQREESRPRGPGRPKKAQG
ncbi:hypothetical protein GCM10007933_21310 [Zoogloea oryzae]|uniref:DUF3102 domain-containing protein n=1 Tax=Zoogloea oryzae TaxID=310767 RepID=A0ABQ6FBM1_9RHOO|nr:hypothetical protein [Zoogloea oryzae]GLT22671.1 hypothetical protein GCM10007933_21310 [Zoogloea oryzae]